MNVEIPSPAGPAPSPAGGPTLSPAVAEAFRRTARAVGRFEVLLAARVRAAPGALGAAGEHLLSSGGKRLRPSLVVLAAFASGPRRRGLACLAVAAETVHCATLLHDDVIDQARTRRGRASVPAAFGNTVSVLAGDHLFAQAVELVQRAGSPRALAALIAAIRAMVEAEARQLALRESPAFDEATCLSICRGKTASLFRWCAAAGAMAAGARREHEAALAGYGEHVGLAFQLADDLLDLGSPAAVGEDLAQGAITLPMAIACRQRPAIAGRIRTAMRRLRTGHGSGVRAARAVSESVHRTGAVAAVRERIRSSTTRALMNLGCLPDSPYREALARVALGLGERA